MSTKIRLMRLGSMKRPFYRVVVMDSRKRRDGRYLENLGTYNPVPAQAEISLKTDRILHWLSEGAQMTGTVENLIRREGILERFKLLKAGVSAEDLDAKLAEWKAKQPKSTGETLSRSEKKAKKKDDARAQAEAAVAAEKKAAEEAAAAEKKAAEAAAAAEKKAAEAAAAESAPAESAGDAAPAETPAEDKAEA